MIEKNIDENDQAEKSSKLVGLNELLGDLKTQINSPKIIMSPPDFRQIKYNCWCCEDSGKVASHLVKIIHPEYDYWKHLYYACQASHCHALMFYWSKLLDQFNFDLTPEICVGVAYPKDNRFHENRKKEYELWWQEKKIAPKNQ